MRNPAEETNSRKPLGGLDANKSILTEHVEPLGKRTATEAAGKDSEGQQQLSPTQKKRKRLDHYCAERGALLPSIEIPESEADSEQLGNSQGRLDDGEEEEEEEEEEEAGEEDAVSEKSLVLDQNNSTAPRISPPPSYSSTLLFADSQQSAPSIKDSQETNGSRSEEKEESNDNAILRKIHAKERADALRLRLRVAMYKLQTNQVSTPLFHLEIRSVGSSFSSSSSSSSTKKMVGNHHERRKLSVPTTATGEERPAPRPRFLPKLRENGNGEALLLLVTSDHGEGSASPPSSFRERESLSLSLSQRTNASFRSEVSHSRSRFTGRYDATTATAHNRRQDSVPYSRQKRRASPVCSMSEGSDIELEIPQRARRPGWKRDLLQNSARSLEERRRALVEGGGGGAGAGAGAASDGGDREEEINIIRPRRDVAGGGGGVERVGERGREIKREVVPQGSSEDLERAAGGLLELRREGRNINGLVG